jgi:predicted amidophosphoribosyltransferase
LAEIRLQKIDEEMRELHWYLTENDTCYFLFEYTSRKGFDYNYTNQFIFNLKKSPARKGLQDYKYKGRAIRTCSSILSHPQLFNQDWLKKGTLVPVPPSKSKAHAEYDDRLVQVLNGIARPFPVDVRELVIQNIDMVPAHLAPDERLSVEELLDAYSIQEDIADPEPTSILIFDDVLTAGTHYRAMHTILSNRFPLAKIFGTFFARRVFPTESPFDPVEP